jgi:phage gpG-like protein
VANRTNFSTNALANPGVVAGRNVQVRGARSLNIQVQGLADLRRAVKAVDPAGLTAIRVVLKDAAVLVARDARGMAPHRSGRLAAGIRAGTSGNRAVVRDRLPYANLIHWGGSTGRGHKPGVPWSGSVLVRPSLFISRAIDRNEEVIARHLADEFDSLIKRSGWS